MKLQQSNWRGGTIIQLPFPNCYLQKTLFVLKAASTFKLFLVIVETVSVQCANIYVLSNVYSVTMVTENKLRQLEKFENLPCL